MKKLFLVLLPFLMLSCASTKQFKETYTTIENYEDENIEFTVSGRSITSTSETDGKSVLYHTVALPASSVWFIIRETGKVIGYSTVNIFSGVFCAASNGLYEPVAPNLEKAEEEYKDIQKEIEKTKFYKYKKYIKPMSSAIIEESSFTEDIDFNGNTKEIKSEVITKIYVEEDIAMDLKKQSKKASIIGSKIGNAISYVVMFPSYLIGAIIFGLSY